MDDVVNALTAGKAASAAGKAGAEPLLEAPVVNCRPRPVNRAAFDADIAEGDGPVQ